MTAIPSDRLLAFPDTGTCTVIREGVVTHQCEWPGPRETDRLGEGAVVVCTCGRRYIARRPLHVVVVDVGTAASGRGLAHRRTARTGHRREHRG